MGFSLKKAVKGITKAVTDPKTWINPTTILSTDMGMKAIGKGGLFEDRNTAPNPYGKPDLAYLYDMSRLDPLKDASKFDYLRTNANKTATELMAPGARNPYAGTLNNRHVSFANRYTAPTRKADSLFNDLIGTINAPSSVDAVRREVEGDRMGQLLADLDQDAAANVASSKLDFLDRGLGGPGMISDIEANALAQARGDAAKLKAATRTDYAGKELDRIKAREDAARDAYTARYGAGVAADTQDVDIAARGAMQDAQSYNEMVAKDAELAESALQRDQVRNLAGADLAFRGDQAAADAQAARDNLFYQLLNSRDLGAAGIATNLFNAGAERELAGRKPSYFDQFLTGAIGGGAPLFGKALLG